MTIEGLLPVIGRVLYSKDFMVSVISQSRIVKNRCLDLVYLKVEDKYRRPRSQAGTSSSWCSRRTVCAQAQGDSRSLPCCEDRPMVRPPTYLCPLVSLLHCIANEPEGELYRIKVKFKRDLRLSFGDYVHVYEDRVITNTSKARTEEEIFLYLLSNYAGSPQVPETGDGISSVTPALYSNNAYIFHQCWKTGWS